MKPYDTETGKVNESAARRDQKKATEKKAERESRENKGFVQFYPRGLRNIRDLAANPKTVQAARLYALIAENIDRMGAVVATQSLLAKILGVSIKTIQRHSEALEEVGALYRFQVQGGVYVYALNPEEVWAGYDKSKEHAPFYTGKLHAGSGSNTTYIRKSLNIMIDLANLQEKKPKKK